MWLRTPKNFPCWWLGSAFLYLACLDLAVDLKSQISSTYKSHSFTSQVRITQRIATIHNDTNSLLIHILIVELKRASWPHIPLLGTSITRHSWQSPMLSQGNGRTRKNAEKRKRDMFNRYFSENITSVTDKKLTRNLYRQTGGQPVARGCQSDNGALRL
jgi:hypothetical protein